MVTTPKDKNACTKHDYAGTQHEKANVAHAEGTNPGLTKDYGAKNDSELTNGFVPSVRKVG